MAKRHGAFAAALLVLSPGDEIGRRIAWKWRRAPTDVLERDLKFYPDCAMGARPARRLASAFFLQFGYKLLRKIHSAGRFWTLR
ncbi:hypothetical protein MPC1_1160009 [Methylocella tundrae]|nr:hypothetical protein MPC1_1160009 [Methylocella tundrae]